MSIIKMEQATDPVIAPPCSRIHSKRLCCCSWSRKAERNTRVRDNKNRQTRVRCFLPQPARATRLVKSHNSKTSKARSPYKNKGNAPKRFREDKTASITGWYSLSAGICASNFFLGVQILLCNNASARMHPFIDLPYNGMVNCPSSLIITCADYYFSEMH